MAQAELIRQMEYITISSDSETDEELPPQPIEYMIISSDSEEEQKQPEPDSFVYKYISSL